MRVIARGVAIVVLMLSAFAPASAGTSADPELRDACGATVSDDRKSATVAAAAVDLCAGWFDTLSNAGEAPVIRVTTTVAAADADAADAGYAITWGAGGCGFGVIEDDSAGKPTLRVNCGDGPETCAVPQYNLGCQREDRTKTFELPQSSVVREGSQIRFTVRFDGALAQFAQAHQPGGILRHAGAYAASGVVDMETYMLLGCAWGTNPETDHCVEINGDEMRAVRPYTVGT